MLGIVNTLIFRLEIQILLLLTLSMTKLSLILVIKPYEEKKDYYLDIFNELCIWITVYTLLTFTDANDVESRPTLGLFLCALTSFQLLVGLIIVLISIITASFSSLKNCCMKKVVIQKV